MTVKEVTTSRLSKASRSSVETDRGNMSSTGKAASSAGGRMMNPPSTNDADKRSKAVWDLKATEYFVQTCLAQVSKGERIGTSFTKKGWKCIVSEFNDLTGRKYDKAKLKNRYDNLRKDWRAWYNLFGKETGLGWDPEKNTFDTPDEWWDNKQLENPLYGKFRNKGRPFAPQLTTLFKDVVANGEFMFATSFVESLPNDPNDYDDGYHPCLDNIVLGTEEGSGDSEDASIGATDDFANIGLNSTEGVISQKSGEKRKRTSGAEKTSKKKASASSKIAEAVSVIAETCKSRNDTITNASIGEVMAEIQNLEEVMNDLDWQAKCCQLMMFKRGRCLLLCEVQRIKG